MGTLSIEKEGPSYYFHGGGGRGGSKQSSTKRKRKQTKDFDALLGKRNKLKTNYSPKSRNIMLKCLFTTRGHSSFGYCGGENREG